MSKPRFFLFHASIALSLLAISGTALAGDAGSVITSWVRAAIEAKQKPVKEVAPTPSSDPVVAKINQIIADQKNLIADLPHQNQLITAYNKALDNLRQIEDYLKTSNPDEAIDRKQKLAAVKAIQLLPPANRAEFKPELERLQYFGGEIAPKAASLLLSLDASPLLLRPSGMPSRLATKKPLLTQAPYDANIAEMNSLIASRKACPTAKKWKSWMDDLDKREAALQKQISDLEAKKKEVTNRGDAAQKEQNEANQELSSAEAQLHPSNASSSDGSNYNPYDSDRPIPDTLESEERALYQLNQDAGGLFLQAFMSPEDWQKYNVYYTGLGEALTSAATAWVGNGAYNFDAPGMLLGRSQVGPDPVEAPFWKPGKDSSEKALDIKSLEDLNSPRFQKFFVEKIGSSSDPDFRYHLTQEGKKEINKLFPSFYEYSSRREPGYDHLEITSIALNDLAKLDEMRKTALDDARARKKLASDYSNVVPSALNRLKEASKRVAEAKDKLEQSYGGEDLTKEISDLKDQGLKAVQTARQKVEDLRNVCREADADVLALDGRAPSSHLAESIKDNYDQVSHTASSGAFDEMIHPRPPAPKQPWQY